MARQLDAKDRWRYAVRIRSLKPEFWLHETLSRLSEFTRLMAIALLNYADDEGYFYANPILIRGAIFPFVDDSGRIRGAVGELSGIGYLRLGTDTEGREVGHIINFSKHQRGDKFKTSKLKELAVFPDVSATIPRLVPDSSPLDQGSGIRDQGSGNGRETSAKSAPTKTKASDEDWISQLQQSEAYRHLSISTELSKAEIWCSTNSRQCTRRFFTNWLNRASANTKSIALPNGRQSTQKEKDHEANRKIEQAEIFRKMTEDTQRRLEELA